MRNSTHQYQCASSLEIRDSNIVIKVIVSRHMSNASLIVTKCMILRYDILAARNNRFLKFEIEFDSKIVMNCYNVQNSIKLIMEDI